MSTPQDISLILVVDDNEAGLYRKSHVLRRAGFDVLTASDGTSALEIATTRAPRLMLLDVKLPDVDGLEVCRRLKENDATASIIVVQTSATYVTERDTVMALESGADACLHEPVDPFVLVATTRALIRARRAEDALRDALDAAREAQRAAEEANKAKDGFLATLSHELRAPLSPILTWVALLRDGKLDAAKQRQGLDSIERNTRLQVRLIEDLLDVSRIISGKLHIDPALVELASLMTAVVENARGLAQSKGITLESEVDPAAGTVFGDAARLEQVISNLLSNAIKFTPNGGTISVDLRRQNGHVDIVVRDSGEGIAPNLLPYVFDRFRQGDSSTTRRSGGLGLGLAIVRHLTELHGGTVSVISDGPNTGSTFRVRLPARGMKPLPPIAPMTLPDAIAASDRLDGMRLLVVDDERDAREALSTVLEHYGAQVQLAGSVDEALAVMETAAPDLLLSDIAMPGADGYALLAHVLEHNRSHRPVRAIAVSAHAGPQEQARALGAGFAACVGKPVDVARLVTTVRNLRPL